MKKILIVLSLIIVATDSFSSGIASNSASAPCTNNTLETYSGNSNLAADWQPNTINLSWYNENEKLTVQQSAQSCVYDGTLTIPSTPPTRTGYTFAGWKVRIPGTYTELQYIESTGEQRIDTGIYANENTAVETKFINTYSLEGSTTRIIIADAWYHADYSLGGYEITIVQNSRSFQMMGTSVITYYDFWRKGEEYTVYMDKNVGQIVNGVTTPWSGTPSSFTTASQLSVLGTVSDPDRYAYVKLFYLKILQNGDVVRDFIPVRRNSDGVVGMYDTVTQTFFTNAGTGTFIAGPAVQ